MVVVRQPKPLRYGNGRRSSPATTCSRPIHPLQKNDSVLQPFPQPSEKLTRSRNSANTDLRNGTVRRIGQMRRQRAGVHGPGHPLSGSEPPLVGAFLHARRRHLVHLPQRRRQLPRRHRRLRLLRSSAMTRVLGRLHGPAQCGRRRGRPRRAHQPPSRHGRARSAPLAAHQYGPLEPVVLDYRRGGRRR